MKQESKKPKEGLIIVIGSIVNTIGLFLAALAASFSVKNTTLSILTLAGALVMASGNRVVLLFKEETKLERVKNIAIGSIYLVLAILVPFGRNSIYFLTVPLLLFCVSVIINRIVKLIKNHKAQSIVLNTLIILFAFVYALLFIDPRVFLAASDTAPLDSIIILFFSLLLIVVAFKDVIAFIFSRFRFKVFASIIKKTFATEILVGLVVLMFAIAIVLTVIEPSLSSFGDALWYCFSVVTTIGFGDYTSISFVGRMLTVLLGIYGIIVVALITSIIVNFYNEVSHKADAEKFKKIEELDKKLEEQNKEENKELEE